MSFGLDDVRGVMSAVILLTFLGLFAWVAIGGRDRFRAAADLPFADDDAAARVPASVPEQQAPEQ